MVVNRVLRDDSDKSPMHNREPITPKLLWQSLQDYQWSLVLAPPPPPDSFLCTRESCASNVACNRPLYILGLVFMIPQNPEAGGF